MSGFLQDFRFSLRALEKKPGFTAVAVLTLALGIGGTTAVFSAVYGVLLRPLPYLNQERIAQISLAYQGQTDYSNYSAREFHFWQEHSQPFDALAASTGVGFNLTGGAESVRVRASRVSSGYFKIFGVQPLYGRTFTDEEDSPTGPNVAVLSYGLWKTQFGGDPQWIGRAISLEGERYTVVGILPGGFQSTPAVDLWTTIAQVDRSTGSGINYTVLGRLKAGVSREQADAYLGTVKDDFFNQFRQRTVSPAERKFVTFQTEPLAYMMAVDYHRPLLVLFGAIAFVLLIACVNVANLLLARNATRRREIAVRTAMGAGRARLVRQLLTESLVLSLLGAALGLLLAYGGLRFLLALAPADLPRAQEIALDGWAIAFSVLLALVSGFLFGVVPAFQSSRTDLNETLKEGSGRAGGPGGQKMRSALVIAEVSLSLVLLAGASLLIETIYHLLRTDPGFNPHGLLSVQIWPAGDEFRSTEDMANFNRGVMEKIKAIPGVESVAIVNAGLPLERGGNMYIEFPGRKADEGLSADYRSITPEYFHTLGVPLVHGRFFTAADATGASQVAMVNQAFVESRFVHQDPIGARLKMDDWEGEIVGVVGDVRSFVNEPAPPTIFLPDGQTPIALFKGFLHWYPNSLLVRSSQDPLLVGRQVIQAVRGVDANVPIGRVQSMDETFSTSIAFQRFLMTLMCVFAALALTLAAVGIYGVMAYSVAQRTHEIGIRMALGARRGDVLRLVMRRGLWLTLGGIAAGLAGAAALSGLLEQQLYEVKPADPLAFSLAVAALALVACLACSLPAHRATRVDPLVALRHE